MTTKSAAVDSKSHRDSGACGDGSSSDSGLFARIVDWFQQWYRAFYTLVKLARMGAEIFWIQAKHYRAARLPIPLPDSNSNVKGLGGREVSEREYLGCRAAAAVRAIAQFRSASADSDFALALGSVPQKDAVAVISVVGPEGQIETSFQSILEHMDRTAKLVAILVRGDPLTMASKSFSPSDSSGKGAVSTKTHVRPVAFLAHNSGLYYGTVMGIAQATNYLNALSGLATAVEDPTDTQFHITCAALLSTSIPSNAQCYSSLETARASLLIVEEPFLPLLFQAKIGGDGDDSSTLLLHIPDCVKTIVVDSDPELRERFLKCVKEASSTIRVCSLAELLSVVKTAEETNGGDLLTTFEALNKAVKRSTAGQTRQEEGDEDRPLFVSPAVAGARGKRFVMTDPALMIYTSGTTGLPKAAKFTHLRFRGACALIRTFIQPKPNPKTGVVTIYTVLPMHHTAGGILGPAVFLSVLKAGYPVRMVTRKRFSASCFAKELAEYRVDVLQYIGEIFRYAVRFEEDHSPSSRRSHRVQYAVGNGLRPDIWRQTQSLFNIDRMVELYASTEGNVGALNSFNEPFAVGTFPVFPWPFAAFSPPRLVPSYPIKQVKYDPLTEAPLRCPKTGRCLLADFDEPGELLGAVAVGHDPIGLRRFEGYVNDEKSSNAKVIRNVFRQGDMYFRTGDLVRVDRRGFVYFVDRVGDTFRWKGENVSTLEVANALNNVVLHDPLIGVVRFEDSVVYGVTVPPHEGRAGMARLSLRLAAPHPPGGDRMVSIEDEERVLGTLLYPLLSSSSPGQRSSRDLAEGDKQDLRHHGDSASLPSYAIPLFLRIEDLRAQPQDGDGDDAGTAAGSSSSSPLDAESMTSTFKYRKVKLQREGYNVRSVLELTPATEGTGNGRAPRFYALSCESQPPRYKPLAPDAAEEILQGKNPKRRW